MGYRHIVIVKNLNVIDDDQNIVSSGNILLNSYDFSTSPSRNRKNLYHFSLDTVGITTSSENFIEYNDLNRDIILNWIPDTISSAKKEMESHFENYSNISVEKDLPF